MSRVLVTVLIIVGVAGTAHAQPVLTPPASPVSSPGDPVEVKSPAAALGWALVGTGVGVGSLVMAAGSEELFLPAVGLAVVGPSLGHFYAGDWTGGLLQAGGRTLGVGMMGLGAVLVLGDLYEDESEGPGAGAGAVLFVSGAAVGIVSTIGSIVTAPEAARQANREAAARTLMITPTPIQGPGRSTGAGLAVMGAF